MKCCHTYQQPKSTILKIFHCKLFYTRFLNIHQKKMFTTSVLPHCHITGVYHKHGCLYTMLQKQCLCMLDPCAICCHPNHRTALRQSSLTDWFEDHHQACTQPCPSSSCTNSLTNIGSVKPLKITVIVGILHLFNSESLSDINRRCLYGNSKES